MSTNQHATTDAFTFYDLYHADQDRLREHLERVRTVREIRAEKRRLAAVRREALASARTSGLRRRLREVFGHHHRPGARSSVTVRHV